MGISGLFEKVDPHRPGACGGVPSRCKTPLLTQPRDRLLSFYILFLSLHFKKPTSRCMDVYGRKAF